MIEMELNSNELNLEIDGFAENDANKNMYFIRNDVHTERRWCERNSYLFDTKAFEDKRRTQLPRRRGQQQWHYSIHA